MRRVRYLSKNLHFVIVPPVFVVSYSYMTQLINRNNTKSHNVKKKSIVSQWILETNGNTVERY